MDKYCSNCGKELIGKPDVCVNCGIMITNNANNFNYSSDLQDKGGFGWGILGYFFPIVGLILYLIWNKEKPKTSKIAGKGALISLIVSVVFYVVIMILLSVFFLKFEV